MKMKKIFILGNMGSGKSTLAKTISEKLNIKHYDLDDIFWKKKFNKKRDIKSRDKKFKELCNKKQWIIEGAYATWIEFGIKKADLVILLKIPLKSLLWRITKRSIKRNEENIKGWIGLTKATIKYYKRKDGKGFHEHEKLIDKNKVKFILIKNNKELNNFIKKLK